MWNMSQWQKVISIFDGMEIRKIWYQDSWWFVVVDVISVLTNSIDPSDYLKKMRKRDRILSQGWGQIVTPLTIQTAWWKQRANCANTQWILRVIQSISSPMAEPFKQRLSQLGNERIEEYNDPEIWIQRARERAIQTYQKMWMSEKDIESRLSSISIRHNITDIWKAADIESREFWMLTNLWYSWTWLDAEGMRGLKWLSKNDALRDHFSRSEMLLTELAEETSTKLTQKRWSKWFNEVQKDVVEWAMVAKKTKEHMEEILGEKVVTNFNRLSEKQKAIRSKKIQSISHEKNNK
jgi:DNA-damage-inducible protein D